MSVRQDEEGWAAGGPVFVSGCFKPCECMGPVFSRANVPVYSKISSSAAYLPLRFVAKLKENVLSRSSFLRRHLLIVLESAWVPRPRSGCEKASHLAFRCWEDVCGGNGGTGRCSPYQISARDFLLQTNAKIFKWWEEKKSSLVPPLPRLLPPYPPVRAIVG